MRKFDMYIFDFDGTLFDTNKVIHKTFMQLASAHCDSAQLLQFNDFVKENAGISRFKILTGLHNICRSPLKLDDFVTATSEIYNSMKFVGTHFVAPIPGAAQYVADTGEANVIVSGGARAPIKSLLKRFNLHYFFDEIYGSEKTKWEHFANLKEKYPEKTKVYFGDSKHDYESSKNFVDQFVFVSGYTMMDDPEFFDDKDVIKIESYVELL